MEEVYDLHQHKNCVAIFLKNNKIDINYFSTSTRNSRKHKVLLKKDTFIVYDKQHKNILSWGDSSFNSCADNNSKINTIIYDRFRERLYDLFKKEKCNWDQDDMFLLQAVSDFMRLSIKEIIKESEDSVNGTEAFHYVFVTPSEWEEEIRETVIRPIFVKANLISNKDHVDILLFCSDLEAMYFGFSKSNDLPLVLERGKNTVICRTINTEANKVLVELDLFSALNPLFDFSDSVMLTKVTRLKSFSFTTDDIKNSIESLIKTQLPTNLQDEIIQNIEKCARGLLLRYSNYGYEIIDSTLKKPLISDTSKWELNKQQEEFLKSISVFNICSELCKHLFDNLDHVFPDSRIKKYTIFITIDRSNFHNYYNMYLIAWTEYMLGYIKMSLNSKNIVRRKDKKTVYDSQIIMAGAREYALSATRNSDMYSKPRILPSTNLDSCSSIFSKSKPNAIMNIDITLESTLLSFSLLDENGLVKEIWVHKDFLTDSCLRSLGSFFSFSEATTLNIGHSFIAFIKTFFSSETTCSVGSKPKPLQVSNSAKDDGVLEDKLFKESDKEEPIVSIQQQMHIKEFVRMYMNYISKVVSRKLSTIVKPTANMKIGYAVTIENILLQRLFGTEDNLKYIIYASGMLSENDSYKKLRIITGGEGLLPVIQQYSKLQFPVRSYVALAQLHEDYIQLILNQVVTEKEDQEAIAVRDEIIPIPNIYDSLFLNMWNKIVKDNSLIQLCGTHKTKDRIELQEIFSLKNKEEFRRNFKNYISKQILKTNSKLNYTGKNIIPFSFSCECKVCLTVNDIVEISFQPVLQDILSVVSTSLMNDQFFGKYINIQNLFYLIGFNYNPQFQPVLMKIINDGTDQFMYEHEMDTPYDVLSVLSSQLSYPVIKKQPLSYKEFIVGVFRPVYTESYGFSFSPVHGENKYVYKNKRSSTKTISVDEETIFLLFKRGDKISSGQTDRVIYMNLVLPDSIRYSKLKRIDSLRFDKTFHSEDTVEVIDGPDAHTFNFQSLKDRPVKISIAYNSYSSSLSLTTGLVGEEIKEDSWITFGESMTLARF